MPCYDSRNEEMDFVDKIKRSQEEKHRILLDIKRTFCVSEDSYRDASGFLMVVACEACRALKELGMLDILSITSYKWYEKHTERDKLIDEYKNIPAPLFNLFNKLVSRLDKKSLSDEERCLLSNAMGMFYEE